MFSTVMFLYGVIASFVIVDYLFSAIAAPHGSSKLLNACTPNGLSLLEGALEVHAFSNMCYAPLSSII